jgi:hypothetical protein
MHFSRRLNPTGFYCRVTVKARQSHGPLRDSVSCCNPAWHLLFLNVLILLMLRDSGVFESRPARLDSSNQIRNGAILTAQNLKRCQIGTKPSF